MPQGDEEFKLHFNQALQLERNHQVIQFTENGQFFSSKYPAIIYNRTLLNFFPAESYEVRQANREHRTSVFIRYLARRGSLYLQNTENRAVRHRQAGRYFRALL